MDRYDSTSGSGHSGGQVSRDAELIERIQNGDQEAQDLFYREYAARLFYLALKRGQSPEDAQDARSETFLRVLTAIRAGQLRSRQAFPSFCLRTLDNVIHEMQRREQRSLRLPDAGFASLATEFLDDHVKAA